MTEYLTPKEAAEALKVDRLTIYRMIKDGRLPASRIGKRGWRIDERSRRRSSHAGETVSAGLRLEDMPDLVTVDVAAEWMGCSVVTVRRLIHAGTLKRVKVGRLDRIPRTALERMQEAGK